MSTASIRVTPHTRDALRELAEHLDKSMQAVLTEAVEAYRQRVLPRPTTGAKAKAIPDRESLELSGDPNVVAFESLDSDYIRRNAGKTAAFCRGKLVALSASRTELFEILDRDHPEEPCLVTELSPGPPRIVHFRRPMRIFKPDLNRTRHSTVPG
jgi:hypothetical protein